MRDHRKLKAFVLIDAMVLDIYRISEEFPRSEMFGLAAQMRRAIVSSASNIVEGCARQSREEYTRFLEIALGSLRETGYQMSVAHRLGYVRDEVFRGIDARYTEAARVLAGLMKSNRNPG